MKALNSISKAILALALALPCSSVAQTENRFNETIKITDQFKQACKVYKVHPTLHNGNLLIELGGKYGLLDFYGEVNVLCDYDKIVSSPKGIMGFSDEVSYTFNEYIDYILGGGNDIKCDNEGTFIIYNSDEPIQKVDLDNYGELVVTNNLQEYASIGDVGKESFNKETDKTGFVDMSGKEIIPAIYDKVWHEHGDIYLVEQDGKCGFVKAGGKIIIPIEYDDILRFIDDVTIAEKDGKKILIDRIGSIITKHLYDELYNSNPYDFVNLGRIFHNGLLNASREGKYGCINKNGEEVIPCTHEKISSLHSIIIAATKDGKTAFFDYAGRQLTSYRYDDYILSYDGYSIVKENGKYGCLYPNGTEFIPCKYDSIHYKTSMHDEDWHYLFVNGSIAVEKDGKIGFCDITGKETIEPTYDNLPGWEDDESDNEIVVEKNGKYGIVRNSVEVVPCNNDEIPYEVLEEMDNKARETVGTRNKIYKPTPAGYFSVIEEKGKYGIKNKKGKKIIPSICNDIVITPLVGGVIHAVITIDGWKHEGFIDSYGNHTFNERLFR